LETIAINDYSCSNDKLFLLLLRLDFSVCDDSVSLRFLFYKAWFLVFIIRIALAVLLFMLNHFVVVLILVKIDIVAILVFVLAVLLILLATFLLIIELAFTVKARLLAKKVGV
jgi:hypothetical protein